MPDPTEKVGNWSLPAAVQNQIRANLLEAWSQIKGPREDLLFLCVRAAYDAIAEPLFNAGLLNDHLPDLPSMVGDAVSSGAVAPSANPAFWQRLTASRCHYWRAKLSRSASTTTKHADAEIADRLAAAKNTSHLTWKAIAAGSGVSESTLYAIKRRANKTPEKDTVDAIVGFFVKLAPPVIL